LLRTRDLLVKIFSAAGEAGRSCAEPTGGIILAASSGVAQGIVGIVDELKASRAARAFWRVRRYTVRMVL